MSGASAAGRLSVIVPVYNVEPYLATCLESLTRQTRRIDEILAVDDESTDGSSAILQRYALRHSNLHVIRVPHGGLACARNAGLERATGDWIGFVDSDDWILPQMYERLLELANSCSLDMALCNATYHHEGREPDSPVYSDGAPRGPMAGGEWLTWKLERRTFLHMVWMHLYRRDFLEAHGMRFVEGLIHEDVIWTTRALMLARAVAYDDAQLYAYRKPLRRFAAEENDERLLRIISSAKTNARTLADLAASSADRRLGRAVRWQLVDGGLSVFHKIRQLSTPALRRAETQKLLKEKYFSLLWHNAPELRQKRKIASRYARALIG